VPEPTAVLASRQYAEAYLAEDAVLQAARTRGVELGCTPIGPGGGAALRFLAAATSARAVVEVGTGAGVSGLWLLRGMRPGGVLTTVDKDPEHQRAARQAFAEAGIPSGRTRLITGAALEVLPRLADGGYDLVFVDADLAEHPACVAAGGRLLRPGGVLAVHHALAGGRIGDPAARDPDTVSVREVVKELREAEEWVTALLPAGDGLLAAVKR
jgi:predicted O-methyltransferase YrrM